MFSTTPILFLAFLSVFILDVVSAFSNIPKASALSKRFSHRHSTKLLMENEPPLTKFLDGLSKTSMDNTKIQKNALVVTKYDIPDLGIFADQTYELQSIYLQGLKKDYTKEGEEDGQSSIIEKIELDELDLNNPSKMAEMKPGYTLYVSLYSSMYHDNDKFGGKAVVSTPEEVGLVSMKDEVADSILVALPILSFWLGTCYTFSSWYNDKYGGNFFDALFRT
ncbi:hypothetical protein CTEN210_05613 [Chaetoceros tenuissimus]|uniref:Uncharacterized protein n=1 Tax=Chaetoceros tenuissimus TaxID=426638 RepID=A0AAD3CNA6_9STRA|nr:hypothetical protein CTEN210_05613 [Chaetoceros tenuissimus]